MKETRFKQTEIGEVPEDWEVTTLGKLGKFSKGAGISREQSHSGFIPAIRYGEIYTTHHDYIKQFNSFISEEVAKTSRKLEYGDLLFSSSGETKEEIGKSVAFVSDFEAYAGGDIIIISPDTKKYYPKFWGFYLNSMPIVKQKALRGQGDAVVHIVSKDLASIIVAHPKPEEQERIAEALSDVDKLLRELDAEIAKKRAIKQGAMQELLTGKRRLEGFGGEYKDSEFGLIPKDWTIVEIKNKGNLIRDSLNPQQYKTRDFYEYSMPAYDDGKKPVKCKSFTMNSNRTCIKGEVLLFNKLNVRQKRVWYVENAPNNSLCSMEFLALTSNTVDLRLLREVLLQNKVTQYFESASEGTSNSQKRINPSVFLNYRVVLPSSKAEQTAIAKILSDMDADIEVLEAKRAKYAAVKQGMMQELLTGRIRLINN